LSPFSSVLAARRPLRATLFPYTTLFRSDIAGGDQGLCLGCAGQQCQGGRGGSDCLVHGWFSFSGAVIGREWPGPVPDRWRSALRSEEHTSELQSRENLVCRLLLEKKTK